MNKRTPLSASAKRSAGIWLGLLGVLCFAMTLPATRLATGSGAEAQLAPAFVTAARAALAGMASLLFLLLTRSRWPAAAHWPSLAWATLGNVLGYPLLVALALRSVTAAHAAVITALLPLASALVSAWVLKQRAAPAFWLCAAFGSSLVLVFAWQRSQSAGGFGLDWADAWLFLAVLLAALGYAHGTKVTQVLGAEQVICWMCVLALPLSLPAALWLWPDHSQAVRGASWWALLYLGLVSMWAGFFAWFRGLAWGGALRVGQLQLGQPFLSMLLAVPLLGEALQASTLGFAAGVALTVFVAQRLARPKPLEPTP